MMSNNKYKFSGLIKLFFSIICIVVFVGYIAPLLTNLPLVQPIAEIIEENEIDAGALFYTDIEEFTYAELSINTALKYSGTSLELRNFEKKGTSLTRKKEKHN